MVKKVQDEESYCLIIFVDEQTDREFLKEMVNYLREKNKDKKMVNVIYKNLHNEINYNNATNIFRNEIMKKPGITKDLKFKVICFYDILKTPYKIKPYVDWKKIKKELSKEPNILQVYDIKAKNSIEDWFLHDIEGLCKFLNMEEILKLENLIGNTGYEKVRDLFLKNSKVYPKNSYNVLKFIHCLNFETLYNKLVDELKILTDCLFIDT